jgi:hypothetical protein
LSDSTLNQRKIKVESLFRGEWRSVGIGLDPVLTSASLKMKAIVFPLGISRLLGDQGF